MEACGVPTFVCVFLLIFTGAIYASAEELGGEEHDSVVEHRRGGGARRGEPNPTGRRREPNSRRITASGNRNGISSDSDGVPEPRPITPRPRRGSRQGRRRNPGRNPTRTPGRNNRGRGREVDHSRPGRRREPDRSLDRRTIGLVYRLSNASTPFALQMLSKLQPALLFDHVFSPHSIHTVMTMTSLGARGRTQREMINGLGLRRARLRREREHRAYHALLTSLTHTHRDVHVLSANAVFVKPNIPLELTFRQQLEQMYYAKFDTFKMEDPAGPEHVINTWVAAATRDKITDLIGPGSIDDMTAMILVNAIYLNATWAQPFNPNRTTTQPFHSLSQGDKMMPMMQSTLPYRYANHHHTMVVELPYKGDRLAMYVLLPDASSNITQLAHFLADVPAEGPTPLDLLTRDMEVNFLSLTLPKFQIDSGLVDLSESLKKMGIVKAFSTKKSRANFSGISVVDLFIDKVVHKAVIDVQEGGTIASAATAVYLRERSFRPPSSTEMRVDRPFMFFIKDKLMNTVLFLGTFLGQTSPVVTNV